MQSSEKYILVIGWTKGIYFLEDCKSCRNHSLLSTIKMNFKGKLSFFTMRINNDSFTSTIKMLGKRKHCFICNKVHI
jgi:hypothetical protein